MEENSYAGDDGSSMMGAELEEDTPHEDIIRIDGLKDLQ